MDVMEQVKRLQADDPVAAWAIIAAAVLLLLMILAWLIRRRRPVPRDETPEIAFIDVGSLPAGGPLGGSQLELYGTPVRLELVVVAPVGRYGKLPPSDEIPDLLEQMIPGLKAILSRDKSDIVCWPGQLSSQGFIQSFFNHVLLPGERGKDTPWCSVAGRFRGSGQNYLAGLVLAAEDDNSLSQFELQHEGQWHDALRIPSLA